MGLSIIIVNYKSSELIVNCLKSAYQFRSASQFEWLVVDNHSEDGSRELILSAFPETHWIPMGYNAGFARANNEGIRQAKNDIVLLLNPDTLILDDAIFRCYTQFSTTEFAACSVQLLNADLSPQISGNFFIKGGLNHLLPLPYLGPFLKVIATLLRVKKPNIPRISGTMEVDWINGAFMMIRQSALQKEGKFDPDFFLYAEEIELCSRLKKFGKIMVYGNLHIIHLQGESLSRTGKGSGKGYSNLFDERGLQLMVSNQLRIRKQYGLLWFSINLLMYTLEIPILVLGIIYEYFLRDLNSKLTISRLYSYSVNVIKLWQISPKIIAKKPWLYKMI